MLVEPRPADVATNGGSASTGTRPSVRARTRSVLPGLGTIPFTKSAAAMFVVLNAMLTLEWIVLLGAGGNDIKFFHLAAIAFMLVFLLRSRPGRSLGLVLRHNRAVYLPWITFLLLVGFIGLTQPNPYFNRSELIRQGFYGGTSVFVAALFVDIEDRVIRRILTWVALATVVTVMAGLSYSLLNQGTNPLTVLGEAIRTGNPDVLGRQLLRTAFRSQDLTEASVSLRHKVFSAVLIATFLAAAVHYRPRAAGLFRRELVFVVSIALGFALVILSLSRSVTLCALLTFVVFAVRVLLRRRAHPFQALAIASLLVVAAIALLSPLGDLVLHRYFQDTSSYQGRTTAIVQDLSIGKAVIAGVNKDAVTRTPHNIVIDALLSGGLLPALCALLWLAAFFVIWWKEVRRYVTGAGGWVLPVGQIWVIGLGFIPLIRSVTAGNGFHMTEWVAVGATLGIIHANDRAARRQPAPDATGEAPFSGQDPGHGAATPEPAEITRGARAAASMRARRTTARLRRAVVRRVRGRPGQSRRRGTWRPTAPPR